MHFPERLSPEDVEARCGRAVPAPLWVSGTLEGLRRPSVAIVGTRAATPYGRKAARGFAMALASAGCCVVSGLALGIDAAAHEGALEAAAPTVGVLGGGHGRFYPPLNAPLADRMIERGGAVLSPFAPEERPHKHYFLARNAVVAALADAVVVVEAPARSGALNTAQWAADRILVFAVPGDVDRPHSAGCHALIRDGAILARGPADVIEALGLARAPAASTPQKPAGSSNDPILRELEQGERSVDELVERLAQPPHRILAHLGELQAAGAVERTGNGRYACAARLVF